MGFFTGRVSFLRYQVDGLAPELFGPQQVERLADHAMGKLPAADKDGVEVGWVAGDDILDTGFDLAKNVVNDALHFALRVDTRKLPADLLRAYARAELQALAAANPSGRPSTKQKKEAKEAARERLEAEAQDGRFTRRKAYPVLWDRLSNGLLVGTQSLSVIDRLLGLFKDTYGHTLTLRDAGRRAVQWSESHSGQALDAVRPSAFLPSNTPVEVAWVKDPAAPIYLGNEFLLWLWFMLDAEGDNITLADESDVTVMITRTLVLDCPRAVSGNETIRSAAPTRLPEARRAIQEGKLPRQAGLIVVRHDQQYEFTLQAETMGVSGAKLPEAEEREERARLEERVSQIRHLIETVDLLYDAFLARRLATEWSEELGRMQRWLQREERGQMAVAG
jgi:Putative exonuclease, RdgC